MATLLRDLGFDSEEELHPLAKIINKRPAHSEGGFQQCHPISSVRALCSRENSFSRTQLGSQVGFLFIRGQNYPNKYILQFIQIHLASWTNTSRENSFSRTQLGSQVGGAFYASEDTIQQIPLEMFTITFTNLYKSIYQF